MAQAFEPGRIFIRDLNFQSVPGPNPQEVAGTATLSEHLRHPATSVPRLSVLATIADCVAGVAAGSAFHPRLGLTLDIGVHIIAPKIADDLAIAARLLKEGRTTVSAEVRFSDRWTGELVAISDLTFIASPRPQDLAPTALAYVRSEGTMPVPFPDHVGVRRVQPGIAEVELGPLVAQASGTVQGGIIALLAEVAAETLCDRLIVGLDVRYLAAVRSGPGRASARALNDALIRVEVRDVGSNDRLTALAMVRLAPGA